MSLQKYHDLPDATPQQFLDAQQEAQQWMDEGGGKIFYADKTAVVKLAVTEYILFTKGLKVKRTSI
jgi:hypothetical protein